MEIAIIGTGNIGGALARHWHAAGHSLHLGSRSPGDAQTRALAEEVGAQAATPAEAARAAEVVTLAIPGSVVVETVRELSGSLRGRTIVVPANQMQGTSGNLARDVAEAAPGAEVIRAFNTIPFELITAGKLNGEPVDGFYVASDGADETARRLISDCGLRPLRAGGVEDGHLLDSLFALWVAFAFRGGRGRGVAFSLREAQPAAGS